MRDAIANGFSSREAYAIARRHEFFEAMKAGGVGFCEVVALGYVDQEAALHMAELADVLTALLNRLAVGLVLVHPYEGGHPDHDAAAFATHLACRRLSARRRPAIAEFASYYNHDGNMRTGAFLPGRAAGEIRVALSVDQRARKQRMLACYATQQQVIQNFGVLEERFRAAPAYDFTAPPHSGQLFYEQFPWGMSSERWTTLAREAQRGLGLC